MSAIQKVVQGDRLPFNCTIDEAIVLTATEIEFVCQPQSGTTRSFKKDFSAAEITKVSATEFTVNALDEADTASLAAGLYSIQARITDGGLPRAITWNPDVIEIVALLDFS